jgi:hypothetical protein
MQIKAADEATRDVVALEALLTRPYFRGRLQSEVTDELRKVRAGLTGEREAAREIELNFGRSRNFMTIHDLRFEVDGFAAQIDHLILNRLGEIWVCETKHFVEGVAVNEYSEWFRYWRGNRIGMASPIEQNRRHMLLLSRLFEDGRLDGPKRLGIAPMKPDLRSLVLVSNNASIGRPRKRVPGLEQVIKIERLEATVRGAIDASSPKRFMRFIGADALEAFARRLAAVHQPIAFNWPSRFGLSSVEEASVPRTAVLPSPERARRGSGHRCAACDTPVSFAVVKFCWNNAKRFENKVFCIKCQATM